MCLCVCVIIGAVKIELNSGYGPIKIATAKFLGPVKQAVGPGTKYGCTDGQSAQALPLSFSKPQHRSLLTKTWTH